MKGPLKDFLVALLAWCAVLLAWATWRSSLPDIVGLVATSWTAVGVGWFLRALFIPRGPTP